MRLHTLHIQSRFKNIDDLKIDFRTKEGLTVLIGNNGSRNSSGLSGEDFVAAELYRRGYSLGLTMGNAKSIDILAEKDGNLYRRH